MPERRHSPRRPLTVPVYLTAGGRCREERLLDASAGGARLLSDARLRVGDPVKLFVEVLDHRGRARTALVKATVARAIPGPRGARGFGVRFQPGARDTRALLSACVERLYRSGAA